MPAKKQITKDMILSTAFEMLQTGGMDMVNVKALAKRLNCSTQPIYLSFNSMDELRHALSSMAVNMFLNKIQNSSEAANLYGMTYIQFAKEEKELFCFLFMRQNAFTELKEVLEPIMDQSISRLMEQYHIQYEEAHLFHDQLWVHTHGIASMIVTGFCDWDMDKVKKMLVEGEEYLSRKYEK